DQARGRHALPPRLPRPVRHRLPGPPLRPAGHRLGGDRPRLHAGEDAGVLHATLHAPEHGAGGGGRPARGPGARLGGGAVRRGLVNEVKCYAYTPQDPGLFTTTLTLQPPQAAAALEAAVKCLQQLTRAPVPQDELDTVKKLIESDAVYQRETVEGVSRKLGFF